MSEMGDSSTENNEFQFYLLLVRQYIFQLPEEDERVRAAAWMVHLRRLRDAKDLKLRNDYIKLLLFAMHSRCLIGPFAQPPQKDKGLEHFPKNFTFPEMMRHLIEESNAQSMRYCQSKRNDQLPFNLGECREKNKVQETLEDSVALPTASLSRNQTYQYNFQRNIAPTESKEGIVNETNAVWVSGSESSKFSPDYKAENLTKLKDENRKECQYITKNASVKEEERMKSVVDEDQEPQFMRDTGVSLHNSCERISININPSTFEENESHEQTFFNTELHEKNQMQENTSRFTDILNNNTQNEINISHYINEKNINNETYSPFKYSEHSHYQHCHHHHHQKTPVCHSNSQKISALEMEVTGRKYTGQMPPQIPVNGGRTTYAKQDFSISSGHSCFSSDFRDTRGEQETNTCWPKVNFYNNLQTNPLILNYHKVNQHTTNNCNHEAQENCRCSHTLSTFTEDIHSYPLDRKNNAECIPCAKIKEQGTRSDEIMDKNSLKQSYMAVNGVNRTENSQRHKSVIYDSGRIRSLNVTHHNHEEVSNTKTEEHLPSACELPLPLHATNELSNNDVRVREQKSAQESHLKGSTKQIFHTQTETQENTSSSERHAQSKEDILSGMIPTAKSSEFSVAKFRASLSADLGAYSAGYAAGYSAGYAAGIKAALHSPAEHLYSVLQ